MIDTDKCRADQLELGQASITTLESGRLLSKRMAAPLTFLIDSASVMPRVSQLKQAMTALFKEITEPRSDRFLCLAGGVQYF